MKKENWQPAVYWGGVCLAASGTLSGVPVLVGIFNLLGGMAMGFGIAHLARAQDK